MRTVKLSVIFVVCACMLLVNGCNSELQGNNTRQKRIDELEAELAARTLLLDQSNRQLANAQQKDAPDQAIQNDTRQKKINELEAELAAKTLQLDQSKRQFATAQQKGDIEAEAQRQIITALEEDLAKKRDLIASLQQSAGEATPRKAVSPETDLDKISYVLGTKIAQPFKAQGIEINTESFMSGLKEVMAGKELALGQGEMGKIYADFQQRLRAGQVAKRKREAVKNLAEGTTFLKANGVKEGVKVLPSGLQYKVIKKGTGNTPTATDKVKTNYRGRLLNGTEFDSSYKNNKPAEFPVNRVIPGWTEALQLMKEGGKWELYIPANLAYGTRGSPSIPPNSTLIFEIELLEVVK